MVWASDWPHPTREGQARRRGPVRPARRMGTGRSDAHAHPGAEPGHALTASRRRRDRRAARVPRHDRGGSTIRAGRDGDGVTPGQNVRPRPQYARPPSERAVVRPWQRIGDQEARRVIETRSGFVVHTRIRGQCRGVGTPSPKPCQQDFGRAPGGSRGGPMNACNALLALLLRAQQS